MLPGSFDNNFVVYHSKFIVEMRILAEREFENSNRFRELLKGLTLAEL